jgi:hypothetical protein
LNKNVLVPTLRKYLIYDNGASLKGKGTSFTRKRLKIHWNNAIKEYGTFYILKIDIKKYFENIDHELLWNMLKDKIDESVRPLTKYVLVSDIVLWYKSWKFAILKSGHYRKSVFTIDKYFHRLYDNVVQVHNKCYRIIGA